MLIDFCLFSSCLSPLLHGCQSRTQKDREKIIFPPLQQLLPNRKYLPFHWQKVSLLFTSYMICNSSLIPGELWPLHSQCLKIAPIPKGKLDLSSYLVCPSCGQREGM